MVSTTGWRSYRELALMGVLPSLAGDERRARLDLHCDGSLGDHFVVDANLGAGQLSAAVTYSCWYTAFSIQTIVMNQVSNHAWHAAGPGGLLGYPNLLLDLKPSCAWVLISRSSRHYCQILVNPWYTAARSLAVFIFLFIFFCRFALYVAKAVSFHRIPKFCSKILCYFCLW